MIGSIFASVAGGLLQRGAAKRAAASQEAAAQNQIDFATETRDLTRNDLSPFYGAGVQGQNALMQMLGLNPVGGGSSAAVERYEISPAVEGQSYLHPTRDRDARAATPGTPAVYGYRVGGREFTDQAQANQYASSLNASANFKSPVTAPYDLTLADFEASPGYQFRLNQGLEAVQGSAAQRHGLNSGATMQAMNDYAQGSASQEYGNFYGRKSGEYYNYLNSLAGLANTGQNAAAGMGGANSLASGQVNQAYGNIGNAQAAGTIGAANALSDGIGNAYGAWKYNNLLNKGGNGGTSGGFLGGLFG